MLLLDKDDFSEEEHEKSWHIKLLFLFETFCLLFDLALDLFFEKELM